MFGLQIYSRMRAYTMRRLGIVLLAGATLALAGCSLNTTGAAPTNAANTDTVASPTASTSSAPTATTPASPTPAPTKPITISSITPYTGSEVGIAQPLVIKFSRSIPRDHRVQVEQALSIGETKPAGVGAWHWWAADELHFRPYRFWPAHSVVTLDTAAYNNLNLGWGYYGKGIGSVHWTIGRSLIIYVDGSTDYAHVYVDGKLARTMPVSLGKPGWESRSGIKVVQEHYITKLMTGASIGAETNYSLHAPYATRITASGEFLHGAPWAYYRLGKYNGSHGCTNLTVPDAEWIYYNAIPGDPVVTSNTGRPMEIWNTFGDWNADWTVWLAGSSAGDVQVGPAGAPVGIRIPTFTLGKLPPQPAPTTPPTYTTATPTPTATKSHTPSPKPKPTPTKTHTPSPTPKPTPTHTPTPTPTKTATPTPTASPSAT